MNISEIKDRFAVAQALSASLSTNQNDAVSSALGRILDDLLSWFEHAVWDALGDTPGIHVSSPTPLGRWRWAVENRSTVLKVLTPGGRAVHVMLAVFVDGDFIYRPFDSADLRDHDGCASFGECAYRLDPPDGAVESLVAAAVADIRSDLQQMDVQATGPRPTAIGLMRAAGWRLVVDDGEYPARSMLKAAGLPVEGPATLAARWIKYVGSAQTQIVAVEGDAAFRDDLERCRTAAG